MCVSPWLLERKEKHDEIHTSEGGSTSPINCIRKMRTRRAWNAMIGFILRNIRISPYEHKSVLAFDLTPEVDALFGSPNRVHKDRVCCLYMRIYTSGTRCFEDSR